MGERPHGTVGASKLDLPGYHNILTLKAKEHLYFCHQIPSIPLKQYIAHVQAEETEAQSGVVICPGLQSPVRRA